MPAKAGIQLQRMSFQKKLDSRLRGNDNCSVYSKSGSTNAPSALRFSGRAHFIASHDSGA